MENENCEIGEDTTAKDIENKKKLNVFAVIGLCFSIIGAALEILCALSGTIYIAHAGVLIYFFLPSLLIGAVLGIIGVTVSKRYRSGLAISIVAIVLGILGLLAFAGFFLLIVLIFTGIGKA